MCSCKTWRNLTLPYCHGLTFHSLSSVSGSKRKHTTPTDHWALWSCIPEQGFCLFPFAVHKQMWGNAAVGIGNEKQGTETRRQAKAWGTFCFPFSSNILGFHQHDNCFFPKHASDSKSRKERLGVHDCKASDQVVKKHNSICYVSLDACPAFLVA